jgi:hypothetical protein
MASTNSFRSKRAAAALLLAAALAAPALSQVYEHPGAHWKIDFPPGWALAERTPRGAVASSPKGLARLAVYKARTAAKSAAEWLTRSKDADRRRYGPARVRLRSEVSVRGHAAVRVEFDYDDPASGRAMRGWRTIFVEDGAVDEIAYEAAAEDYAANRAAAEGALRSFLPSFETAAERR